MFQSDPSVTTRNMVGFTSTMQQFFESNTLKEMIENLGSH